METSHEKISRFFDKSFSADAYLSVRAMDGASHQCALYADLRLSVEGVVCGPDIGGGIRPYRHSDVHRHITDVADVRIHAPDRTNYPSEDSRRRGRNRSDETGRLSDDDARNRGRNFNPHSAI